MSEENEMSRYAKKLEEIEQKVVAQQLEKLEKMQEEHFKQIAEDALKIHYELPCSKRYADWKERFDDRQKRLIQNCIEYANGDPAGLPGHQLMLIIAVMAEILDK